MTRFIPACESLDARALPSTVMVAGGDTALIGLLRDADDGAAAGWDVGTWSKKFAAESHADPAVELTNVVVTNATPADPAAANQHGGYDLVKNVKGFTDEPGAAAGILTIQDNALDSVATAAAAGYDHTPGGGTWAIPVGDGAAGYYLGLGQLAAADTGPDPDAGMLLPAVQKVREAASR